MQNHKYESPYQSLSCKSHLVFDYEINNLEFDNEDDLNSKIYYHDKNSKTKSNYIFIQKSSITTKYMTIKLCYLIIIVLKIISIEHH